MTKICKLRNNGVGEVSEKSKLNEKSTNHTKIGFFHFHKNGITSKMRNLM